MNQFHERECYVQVEPRTNTITGEEGFTAFVWRGGTCIHVLVYQPSPEVARDNAVSWVDRRIATWKERHA
jgi:hypothetical protein